MKILDYPGWYVVPSYQLKPTGPLYNRGPFKVLYSKQGGLGFGPYKTFGGACGRARKLNVEAAVLWELR